MRNTGNFNLEWGYLAPAPSFLRSVRLVVVAATIAATASAAASSPWSASRRPRPPSRHARWCRLSKLLRRRRCRWRRNSKRNPNTHQRRTRSMQLAQPGAKARLPSRKRHHFFRRWRCRHRFSNATRANRCRCRRDVQSHGASIARAPNKKVRETEPAKDPAPAASRLRVASAQNAVKPTALPLAHNVVRNSVDNNNDLRDDDLLLARTMGLPITSSRRPSARCPRSA